MKTTLLVCATTMLFLGATVDSEPAADPQPQTALAALQTVKEKNTTMIASQVKTLATLDDLSKAASQLKNFARRL